MIAGAAALVPEAASAAAPFIVPNARRIPWRDAGGYAERPLSPRPDGARLLKLPAGAAWQPAGMADLFVLKGRLRVADREVGRSVYVRGSERLAVLEDTLALVFAGGSGPPALRDTWDIAWAFAQGWQPAGPSPQDLAEQPGQPLSPASPAALVKVLGEAVRLCAILPTSGGTEGFAARSALEICVLQGAAQVGAHALAAGAYARFDAGTPLGPWTSVRGCVALLRFAGSAEMAGASSPRRREPLPAAPSPWSATVGV